jgi:hypothetical protein
MESSSSVKNAKIKTRELPGCSSLVFGRKEIG